MPHIISCSLPTHYIYLLAVEVGISLVLDIYNITFIRITSILITFHIGQYIQEVNFFEQNNVDFRMYLQEKTLKDRETPNLAKLKRNCPCLFISCYEFLIEIKFWTFGLSHWCFDSDIHQILMAKDLRNMFCLRGLNMHGSRISSLGVNV